MHLGDNKIANTLRSYRNTKGLSQAELAGILELKLSDYKLMEDGNRPVPYKTVKIMFDKLELSGLRH